MSVQRSYELQRRPATESSTASGVNLVHLSPEDTCAPERSEKMRFSFLLLGGLFQILIIVLYAVLVDYGDHAQSPHRRIGANRNNASSQPKLDVNGIQLYFPMLVDYGDHAQSPHRRIGANQHNASANPKLDVNDIQLYFPMFMHIHVMICFAFPYLLSFYKRFSYSGVAYAFFGAALSAQWGMLMTGIFNQLIEGHPHIELNIQALTGAEFTAATVVIAYCSTMGYCSRLQLVVIAFFLPIFYAANEMVLIKYLKVSDAGASMLVHIFGAYYGLVFCKLMYRKDSTESSKAEPSYNSDLFSFIGSLLLWIYWPSFNAAFAAPDYVTQHRIVINTYLSLGASAVVVFLLSSAVNKEGKICMAHIQNAILAGGVAVGTASSMHIHPWGALLLGSIGGAISTFGFQFLSPLLIRYLRINDVAGIHNLHALPGILGGVAGSIAAAHAEPDVYGHEGLFNVFAARAPVANSTEFYRLQGLGVKFSAGDGRSAKQQALFQLAAVGVTIGIAMIGGLITGLIALLRAFEPPKKHELYDDHTSFQLPEGKESYSTMEFIMTTLGLDDKNKNTVEVNSENDKDETEAKQELTKDK